METRSKKVVRKELKALLRSVEGREPNTDEKEKLQQLNAENAAFDNEPDEKDDEPEYEKKDEVREGQIKSIREGGLVPVEITAKDFLWGHHEPVAVGTIIGMTAGQAHSAQHNKYGKIIPEK